MRDRLRLAHSIFVVRTRCCHSVARGFNSLPRRVSTIERLILLVGGEADMLGSLHTPLRAFRRLTLASIRAAIFELLISTSRIWLWSGPRLYTSAI